MNTRRKVPAFPSWCVFVEDYEKNYWWLCSQGSDGDFSLKKAKKDPMLDRSAPANCLRWGHKKDAHEFIQNFRSLEGVKIKERFLVEVVAAEEKPVWKVSEYCLAPPEKV